MGNLSFLSFLVINVIQCLYQDIEGHEKWIEQMFSVDGSQQQFEVVPRLLLMLNIYSVVGYFIATNNKRNKGYRHNTF